MDFSPILPRTGEALLEFAAFYRDNLQKVSENGTLRFQGPVYMTNWDRTLVALIMFPVSKDKAFNALVGQVMKRSGGRAEPKAVQMLLRQALEREPVV